MIEEKIVGLKEIVDIVNDFTKQFNCKAEIDSDFWIDISNNRIHFALFLSERDNMEFMDSVYRCRPNVTMDIFMWSLLHEIFHAETYDDLTDEEIEYSRDMKDLISMGEIPRCEYYDLPIERLATEGAVKYANTHFKELKSFWEKLQPAILNFYEINNIH